MKPTAKSNDWLNLLLWTFDTLVNPSPRNVLESFDAWDYRHRLRFELKDLRRSGVLEVQGTAKAREWRLTERGRVAANGGIDPISRWSRKWDGQWRLVLFDLPARHQRLRTTLWRWLKRQRLGYLQNSVWVTPDAINETSIPLRHLKLTPDSLTVIEGAPAPPDSNEDIVRSAWDFAAIDRKYARSIEVAIGGRKYIRAARPAEMRKWLGEERVAWMEAIASDPLLPEALWPETYLGRKAWAERQTTFSLLSGALAGRCKK
jgi:phenylacetic acid degradation operon negative regulatory protein